MLLRILIVGITASKVYFLLFSTLQIKAFFFKLFFYLLFILYFLVLDFLFCKMDNYIYFCTSQINKWQIWVNNYPKISITRHI
jgi:hypothetical protein